MPCGTKIITSEPISGIEIPILPAELPPWILRGVAAIGSEKEFP
jgi:hypothetical protein